MCGIAGLLRGSRGALGKIDDQRQAHRGPDDCGSYSDPQGRAALWFRRLSIVDLSAAGHQPMCNESGDVWLAFNGEIYNHAELRGPLEAAGHRFKSRADSEVLIHLWEEKGRSMLGMLNGMFAFCIWDERTGEAFLARDHAGIKPLYVAPFRDGLSFASEAKVLLDLPGVDRSLDPIALQQYLTFLWVPGQRTMWTGIKKLEAGSWLSWKDGHSTTGVWWDWDQSRQEKRSPLEWAAEVKTTLLESVERNLMSDVPLGSLLSGGLDSSAIVGAIRTLHPSSPIRAYTTSIPSDGLDGFADDLPYARLVARALDVDLVEEAIRPEIALLLPQLIWHTDEPLADPAIAASYLLCRRAREDGTVVLLSGQGGDELYHGYRSHQAMRLSQRVSGVPPLLFRLAGALSGIAASMSGKSSSATARRAVKLLRVLGAPRDTRSLSLADWASSATRASLLQPHVRSSDAEVYGEYLALFEQSRGVTDEDRWSYVLFKTFLPALNLTYGDRTSMATSVELRVPYLDRALLEQAGRIPAEVKSNLGQQKWVLAEAAADWLPASIRVRSKTGFGAPVRKWLTSDLRDETRGVLLGERFLARGLFSRAGVARALDDLNTGRSDNAYVVWALLTFELWARTFLDAEGAAPITLVA